MVCPLPTSPETLARAGRDRNGDTLSLHRTCRDQGVFRAQALTFNAVVLAGEVAATGAVAETGAAGEPLDVAVALAEACGSVTCVPSALAAAWICFARAASWVGLWLPLMPAEYFAIIRLRLA